MSEKTESQLQRERNAQVIRNAYHRLFNSEDGRVVLADMAKTFGLNAPVFTPIKVGQDVYSYDPLTAAATDGARRVVIHINAILALPTQGDGDISAKKKPTIRRK
jgi:hypothetical protein